MNAFLRRLARAVMGAQAGGFLSTPPGLDGRTGLGIAALSGVPRPREWDAVASTRAPGLRGSEVHFVAAGDGTLIVDEDEPDGSVAPLAEAVERTLPPPYRAVAERHDGGVWTVAALAMRVVELSPAIAGDRIELSRLDGTRELLVDGRRSDADVGALERIAEECGPDYAVRAERLTETTWVADVSPL